MVEENILHCFEDTGTKDAHALEQCFGFLTLSYSPLAQDLVMNPERMLSSKSLILDFLTSCGPPPLNNLTATCLSLLSACFLESAAWKHFL